MDGAFSLEPMLEGYQLIGDSQLLRLAEKYLNYRRRGNRLGLCVSGQTISELYNAIYDRTYPLSFRIICLIGTNDLTKNTSIEDMIAGMNALVRLLVDQRHVQQLILLTVPPVPRLAASRSHWDRFEIFNRYVSTLSNGSSIRVVETADLFLAPKDFSRCQDSGSWRVSQPIHLRSPSLDKNYTNQAKLLFPKFNQPLVSSSDSLEIKSEFVSDSHCYKSFDFKSQPQDCAVSSSGLDDRYSRNSPFDHNFKPKCEVDLLMPEFMKGSGHCKPKRMVEDMWDVESILPKNISESSVKSRKDVELSCQAPCVVENFPSDGPKIRQKPIGADLSKKQNKTLKITPATSDKSEKEEVRTSHQSPYVVENLESDVPKVGHKPIGAGLSKKQNQTLKITPETSEKFEKEVRTSHQAVCAVKNLASDVPNIRQKPIGANSPEKHKKQPKIVLETSKKLGKEVATSCQAPSVVQNLAFDAPRMRKKPDLLEKTEVNTSRMKSGNPQKMSKSESEAVDQNSPEAETTCQNNKGSEGEAPDAASDSSSKPSKTKSRYYDSYEKHGENPKVNHASPKRQSTAEENCASGIKTAKTHPNDSDKKARNPKLRRSPLAQIYQHLNVPRLPRSNSDIASPVPTPHAEVTLNISISALAEESSLTPKEKNQSDSSIDSYCRDSKITKNEVNASDVSAVKPKSKKTKNQKEMNENSPSTNANSKKSPRSKVQRKKPVPNVTADPVTELEQSNENQVPSAVKSELFPADVDQRTHEFPMYNSAVKQEPLDDYSDRMVMQCGVKSPFVDEFDQDLRFKQPAGSVIPSMQTLPDDIFHQNSWNYPTRTSDSNYQDFTEFNASPRELFNDNRSYSPDKKIVSPAGSSVVSSVPNYAIQSRSYHESNSPPFVGNQFHQQELRENTYRSISYDQTHPQFSTQDFETQSKVRSRDSELGLIPLNRLQEPQRLLGSPVKSNCVQSPKGYNETGEKYLMSQGAEYYPAASLNRNDNTMAYQVSENRNQDNFDAGRSETWTSRDSTVPHHPDERVSRHESSRFGSVNLPQNREVFYIQESNALPRPFRSYNDSSPEVSGSLKSVNNMTGDATLVSGITTSHPYQLNQTCLNSNKQSSDSYDGIGRTFLNSSLYNPNYTINNSMVPLSSREARVSPSPHVPPINNYEPSSPSKNPRLTQEYRIPTVGTNNFSDHESFYEPQDGGMVPNISPIGTGMCEKSRYKYSEDSAYIRRNYNTRDQSNLRLIPQVSTPAQNIDVQAHNSGQVFKRLDVLPAVDLDERTLTHQCMSPPITNERTVGCQDRSQQYFRETTGPENFVSQQPLSVQRFEETMTPVDRYGVQMNRSSEPFNKTQQCYDIDERTVYYNGQPVRFTPQSQTNQIGDREKIGSHKVFESRENSDGSQRFFDEGVEKRGHMAQQPFNVHDFDGKVFKSSVGLGEEMKRWPDNFGPRTVAYQGSTDEKYLKCPEFPNQTAQHREQSNEQSLQCRHQNYDNEKIASQEVIRDDKHFKEQVYENQERRNSTRLLESTRFQRSWADECEDLTQSVDSNEEKIVTFQEYQNSQKLTSLKTSEHFQKPAERYHEYDQRKQEPFRVSGPEFADQRVFKNPEPVESSARQRNHENEKSTFQQDSDEYIRNIYESPNEQTRHQKHGSVQHEQSFNKQSVTSPKHIRDGNYSKEAETDLKVSNRWVSDNRNINLWYDEKQKRFDDLAVKESRNHDERFIDESKNFEKNQTNSDTQHSDDSKRYDTDMRLDQTECKGFWPDFRQLQSVGDSKSSYEYCVGRINDSPKLERSKNSCDGFEDDKDRRHSDVKITEGFVNLSDKIAEKRRLSEERCRSLNQANEFVDSSNQDKGALRRVSHANVSGSQRRDEHGREFEQSKLEKSGLCHVKDEKQVDARVWKKDDEKNGPHDIERRVFVSQQGSNSKQELGFKRVENNERQPNEHVFKHPESPSVTRRSRTPHRFDALSPRDRGSESMNWRSHSRSRSQYSSSSDEDFPSLNSSHGRKSRGKNKSRAMPGYGQRPSSLPRVRWVNVDSPRSRNSSPATSERAEIYKGYPFPRIRMENFEMFFNQNEENKRKDMIHLNEQGLGIIFNRVKQEIFK